MQVVQGAKAGALMVNSCLVSCRCRLQNGARQKGVCTCFSDRATLLHELYVALLVAVDIGRMALV
jgi:hypothetical protein